MFILTNSEREYIPESCKNDENPLTFICKPPSRRLVLDIQEKILKASDEEGNISSNNIPIALMMDLYLSECVTGWKNVTDAEGNPVLFSKEAFASFNDNQILLELYTFVKDLAEGNEKN